MVQSSTREAQSHARVTVVHEYVCTMAVGSVKGGGVGSGRVGHKLRGWLDRHR